MAKDKTTGLSEEEAVAKVQALGKEEKKRVVESNKKLSDFFKDETTGKITLPIMSSRGTMLMERVGYCLEEDEIVTTTERMFMILWAIKNQEPKKHRIALRMSNKEILKEVDLLFDEVGMDEMEDYAQAVSEAIPGNEEEETPKEDPEEEEETPKGNPTEGKAPKKKATSTSGS